jgi:hypothetical protein
MPTNLVDVSEFTDPVQSPTPGGDADIWGAILKDDGLQALANRTRYLKDLVAFGAASALDANGNPTPDTTAFPPANYPLGTLLYATSYPAAQDNGTLQTTTFHAGDMVFRRTGGAGAEVWSWFGGSFRASNGNGNYQRFADRTQECVHLVSATTDLTTASAGGFRNLGGVVSWTYPAAFAAVPDVTGTSDNVSALFQTPSGETATKADLVWWAAASASAVSVAAHVRARGSWAA